MPQGREKQMPEKVIKIYRSSTFNKHLQQLSHHVFCRISKEGIKQTISVARLVYFHFVEEFNVQDFSIVISPKDGISSHIHFSNLELLTISEQKFKMFTNKRHGSNEKKPVSQYDLNGALVNTYQSISEVKRQLGVNTGSISSVLQNISFTANGYRWLPADYVPNKKDFERADPASIKKPCALLNETLWKKLGKPDIDCSNPPALFNLSLRAMPGEKWKSIPGYEDLYQVSNKGRIKKLAGWSNHKKRIYLGEQIMALRATIFRNRQDYCVVLSKNKRKTSIAITRLVFHAFVKRFDLSNHSLVVLNKRRNVFEINPTALRLVSLSSVLASARKK